MISLPENVDKIISTLAANGYEAYAVGGCVRDSLRGVTPNDWDITTSALPQQVAACFPEYPVAATGLKHGTVTIVIAHQPYEVTTYRVDGDYEDNRRPSHVRFSASLPEDLQRRDFTINAMAYNAEAGLVDCFGGQQDLQQKTIRCVGTPSRRFAEDGLRILRALRFASVLGFSIEPKTSESIHQHKNLLCNISAERIQAEFSKLLCGDLAAPVLSGYSDVISVFIPEIEPMIGFEQNNPYHHLDVWRHTLAAVQAAPKTLHLRLAAFFHDMAKPQCYTEQNGTGHFYAHGGISVEMARQVMRRLKYDNETIHNVKTLVKYHDAQIGLTEKAVRRWLGKLGGALFFDLLEIKKADIAGQAHAFTEERLKNIGTLAALAAKVIDEQQCFRLKDLAVNGKDLIDAGIPQGKQVGETLQTLLDKVVDGELPNDKAALLRSIR